MYFLGLLYKIINIKDIFFGSFLSCIFWLLSCFILIKIFNELNYKKYQLISIILYCYLPTSLIYCSVTMREPLMMFVVNYCILILIKIFKKEYIIKNTIVLLSLYVILILLHVSFITTAIFILSVVIVNLVFSNYGIRNKIIIASAFYFLINIIALNIFTFTQQNYHLFEYFNLRQIGEQALARASYSNGMIRSLFSLIQFSFNALFNYFMQPLVFKKMLLRDYVIFFENMIRVAILLTSLHLVLRRPINCRVPIILIFIIYMIIEWTWALGTINWGTAARHHLPTLGLLIFIFMSAANIKENKNDSTYAKN
jgi:hypothetical protein